MEKDYKELYEQALEHMKGCVPDVDGFVHVTPEEIFPELRDNEDEKIRKGIIRYLKQRKERSSSIPVAIDLWIDWLEKKGEQKGEKGNEKETPFMERSAMDNLNIGAIESIKKPSEKPLKKEPVSKVWKEAYREWVLSHEEGATLYCINAWKAAMDWLESLRDSVNKVWHYQKEEPIGEIKDKSRPIVAVYGQNSLDAAGKIGVYLNNSDAIFLSNNFEKWAFIEDLVISK